MSKKKLTTLNNWDWYTFRKEMSKSDDRSCAILSASYIDHCLELVIRNSLLGTETVIKELMSGTMPLSTFSAKSKIAFCLNLIPEGFFNDITRIRKIRNKFAHQFKGLTFDDEPIKTWAMELGTESSIEKVGISDEILSNPRDRFIVVGTLLMNELERRSAFLSPVLKEAMQNMESVEEKFTANFKEPNKEKST